MRDATLTISLRNGYDEPIAASIVISDSVMRMMNPVDLCHDPISRMLSGTNAVDFVQFEHVTMDRKKLAERIAAHVTDELMKFMESRDREQGYTEKELGRPVGKRY
jgi:hypothetical protein